MTAAGLGEALGVARRFAETIGAEEIRPTDVTIVCAPTPEAEATAATLTAQLRGCADPVPLEALDPDRWPHRADEDAQAPWKKIDDEIEERLSGPTQAVVVVGHDPQVSSLLNDLVVRGGRSQRGAGPLPLARSELAMVGAPPGEPLELRWVLSPSDGEVIEELQAKIRSKMDSAKLLGAFLTALLVFAAKALADAEETPVWYPWVGGLGLLLLALATAAYFVTMFRYDELLTPVRFWPSSRPSEELPRGFVARPPSSAAWVLYQNMIRVWFNAFIPATLLGAGGAIAITVALAQPGRFWWLAVALSIAAVLVVTSLVWRKAKPTLGVSD